MSMDPEDFYRAPDDALAAQWDVVQESFAAWEGAPSAERELAYDVYEREHAEYRRMGGDPDRVPTSPRQVEASA